MTLDENLEFGGWEESPLTSPFLLGARFISADGNLLRCHVNIMNMHHLLKNNHDAILLEFASFLGRVHSSCLCLTCKEANDEGARHCLLKLPAEG